MSRRGHEQHPPYGHNGQSNIIPNQHDVLCGRGVNIAQHAGNERFRALVYARHDANYCHSYTTSEKRAVAEDVINHLKSLNPPGRFLKRPGRSKNSRGLEGPWEELSEKEAIKKTCQALRDCNRHDRSGYATSINVPIDVQYYEQLRSQTGMTNKQFAELAAAKAKREAEEAAELAGKRPRSVETIPSNSFSSNWGVISPAIENSEEWAKRKKANPVSINFKTPLIQSTQPTTPTTAASSGILHNSSLLNSFNTSSEVPETSYQDSQHEQLITSHFEVNIPSSPITETIFNYPFNDDVYNTRSSNDHIGLNFSSTEFDSVHLQSHTLDGQHTRGCPSPLLSDTNHQVCVEGIHVSDMHHFREESFLHSSALDHDDFPAPSPIADHRHMHDQQGDLSECDF